jgi:glycosyltransferase involved in cell wall biosynthesis
MKLLRLLGFKIVYTVHDVLPHDEYTVENRRFYQEVYRYADKLIVHCESNRKELLELFTVDPEKICIIPHGCQSACFDTSGTTTTAARRRLGIPDDRRVVLFFGLIKRYKGLEYLLEAFRTIETRCDKALLLIAGKIAPWDGDSHRHHVALLTPYAAWGNIHIRDEYIPQDQAADYFAAADLVVLPYTKASQSGVLLMACAAGKAVVVTDTGGLPEVVQDGRTGFVVPPKDAKAIADASVRILSDPDLGRRFGAQARLLADTVYSWQAIGATTVMLYQSLTPAEATR